MSETYRVLAPFYKTLGLNARSEQLRDRLVNKIQSDGWLGRRILELGCGIGETAIWFGSNGFRITAVDQSAAMLEQAQAAAEQVGVTVDWRQAAMQDFDPGDGYDLVLALNTMNELRRTRDLEAVMRMANRALSPGKLLVFDLVTIRGLVENWGSADYLLYDDPDQLSVVLRSQFSYETSVNTRMYMCHCRQGEHWIRADETHLLRGFALQSVGTLLQRTGFRIKNVLNLAFDVFDPTEDMTGQAIFIATKAQELG